jgi:hypothetical protein
MPPLCDNALYEDENEPTPQDRIRVGYDSLAHEGAIGEARPGRLGVLTWQGSAASV